MSLKEAGVHPTLLPGQSCNRQKVVRDQSLPGVLCEPPVVPRDKYTGQCASLIQT